MVLCVGQDKVSCVCVTKLSRELIARFVLFVVCWWLFLLCRRVKKSTCLKKISSLFHGNSHPTELAGYQLAQLAGYQLAKLAVQQHGQLVQPAGQQLAAQKALREAGSAGPPPCAPTNGRPGFPFDFLGAGGRLPKARHGRVFIVQFFFFYPYRHSLARRPPRKARPFVS